jgi:hypothetical protein
MIPAATSVNQTLEKLRMHAIIGLLSLESFLVDRGWN